MGLILTGVLGCHAEHSGSERAGVRAQKRPEHSDQSARLFGGSGVLQIAGRNVLAHGAHRQGRDDRKHLAQDIGADSGLPGGLLRNLLVGVLPGPDMVKDTRRFGCCSGMLVGGGVIDLRGVLSAGEAYQHALEPTLRRDLTLHSSRDGWEQAGTGRRGLILVEIEFLRHLTHSLSLARVQHGL